MNLPYEAYKYLDIVMATATIFLGFYTGLVWTKSWKKGVLCLGVMLLWSLLDGLVWFKAMELMPH